jgi:hypothetical protein
MKRSPTTEEDAVSYDSWVFCIDRWRQAKEGISNNVDSICEKGDREEMWVWETKRDRGIGTWFWGLLRSARDMRVCRASCKLLDSEEDTAWYTFLFVGFSFRIIVRHLRKSLINESAEVTSEGESEGWSGRVERELLRSRETDKEVRKTETERVTERETERQRNLLLGFFHDELVDVLRLFAE